MPLKKLLLKAGVNRENTRYTSENGWYESDKVRFRQGTPEQIGGWNRISPTYFLGVCSSLWNWSSLGGENLIGVGTNLKFYIELNGQYNDITPIRSTVVLSGPFAASNGSSVITVTDVAHGCLNGDFVTFSGSASLGGNITAAVLNKEFQVTVITADVFTITVSAVADGSDTGNGGASVTAAYQINTAPSIAVPAFGWGAGPWGSGTWGVGITVTNPIRQWSQNNFGRDLVFGPRGGQIYYWSDLGGVGNRAVLVSSLGGTVTFTNASPTVGTGTVPFTAGTPLQFNTTGSMPTGIVAGTTYFVTNVSGLTFNLADSAGTLINTTSTGSGVFVSNIVNVPSVQNCLLVSDTSRFNFAFGANDYGSATQVPMLVRWSDQESITDWTPSATNQAGSILFSHGSKIVTALQTRQEILVFTDSSLYSMQYLGPPVVWGSQLLGDNISMTGQNCKAVASGVVYWMGIDKFYKYDGRVQTLRCDLRQFVFGDINMEQSDQFFAGTNEGFTEVWFFYCSKNSTTIDRYVIYNYVENNGEGAWSYGNLTRTAWLDSGLRNYPMAATGTSNIVYHEYGVDNKESETPLPIDSFVSSAEFDIDDGDRYGFVWRILPDITFRGSESVSPQATMTLIPMQNSGSGFNDPTSVAGSDSATITRTATVPIEQFTGQVYVRVRGRQMIMEVQCNQLGTTWQLGSPRIDIRPDGRRGNA
jgi:hypothetical protein